MEFKKLSDANLNGIAGGNKEEFLNTCKECGKVWDMRPYGYGKDTSMPNWVTGPWCPDCRKKHNEEFFTKSSEQHNDSV